MIIFEQHTLDNGLRVIINRDRTSPMVSVNVLYNVGSKDENPDKTGFAHLFEHLMFGGSVNIPNYDAAVQLASGDNNAFTTSDITNYYLTLPATNIETALWLEADRMLELDFNEKSLEVQRNVVIEEFKQRYLNQPYGDVWLLLRPLAYKVHPYRWATIGKEISHIENATLDDVKDFFFRHYAPNNAILSISGNVDADETMQLVEKWFGGIPRRDVPTRKLPVEPRQTEPRIQSVERKVPFDAIYKTFGICKRNESQFFATDLLSDILSNGKSARLYQNLVKTKKLFSDVEAYLSGDHENGLLIVEGNLIQGVSMEQAEQAIMDELNDLTDQQVSEYELEKVKNKSESSLVYSEMSVQSKATNLAIHELLGDAANINGLIDRYRAVTRTDIQDLAQQIFRPENSSTLYYNAIK